ncbi:MAG: hypothetical protein PHD06_07745 [Bacteroidales bacterium]|nr:hypothetical protein [Bacteroidales bacterium]MDD4385057.1 hypothetical protein [Bacteroidales bacterium]MDY0196296.1 hypothetical protein [Tenuifilaceae bacterium]
MKNNILKLFAIAILPFFITVSCNKNDDNEPLTKQEAVKVLESASQQMGQAMGELMETDAMQAILNFGNLFYGDEVSTPNIAKTTQELVLLAGKPATKPNLPSFAFTAKDEVQDTPFGNYGTYTWNPTQMVWTYNPVPTDKAIFKFPSDETQETNNAVLTLWNVSSFNQEGDEALTSLNLSLSVNNANVLSVFYKLTLDAENRFKDLSLTIEMSPFYLSAGINFITNNTGVRLGLNNEMKKEGVTIQSSNLQMQFMGLELPSLFVEDDGSEPEEDIMPLTVKGFVQMGGLKITLDLDIAEFSMAPTPESVSTYANKNLKISLYAYPAGNKLAYIKWYNMEGGLVPYFVFSNDEEEPVADFFIYDEF